MHKYRRVSPQIPRPALASQARLFPPHANTVEKGCEQSRELQEKHSPGQTGASWTSVTRLALCLQCHPLCYSVETRTLPENAGPALGSLSRAITIDKDEEFREFTDNSNEGSHQMWEKAYFSTRTERKQAVKNQSSVSFLKKKEGAKAGIAAASGIELLSNYQRNCLIKCHHSHSCIRYFYRSEMPPFSGQYKNQIVSSW